MLETILYRLCDESYKTNNLDSGQFVYTMASENSLDNISLNSRQLSGTAKLTLKVK